MLRKGVNNKINYKGGIFHGALTPPAPFREYRIQNTKMLELSASVLAGRTNGSEPRELPALQTDSTLTLL